MGQDGNAGLVEQELAAVRQGVRCRSCAGEATWQRDRPTALHLLPGDVPLARDYASCAACRAGWAPLDEQLGVDRSGRSPRLVEALALLGTELPFRPAAERPGQLRGMWAGASQVEAVTERIGQTLAGEQDAAARAAGMPLGSGAVESANRQVVGVRVKQAGMRWTEPGLRGVLALRALLRGGGWDTWWDLHSLPVTLAA